MTKSNPFLDVPFQAQTPFGTVTGVRKGGQTWYSASELCRALKIDKSGEALDRVAPQDIADARLTAGKGRPHRTVNAAGMFQLFLLSPTGYAQTFRRRIAASTVPEWFNWHDDAEDIGDVLAGLTIPERAAS